MFLYRKNKKIYFILIFSTFFFLLVAVTLLKSPAFKGNLEQEIRIFLKEPYIYNNKESFGSNFNNLIFAFKNKLKKKKLDLIDIEIPFKNFLKIKSDREKALYYGFLEKSKKVNGNIKWKGKNYPVNIRLKGMLADHWNNTKQWSLRIEVKEKESIMGMEEFSLMQHKTRKYPYSFIVSKNLKRMGINTPEFKHVAVKVNGNDWGLMNIEEGFSQVFLEKRKLKKKQIFKLTNLDDLIIGWKYHDNGLFGKLNNTITEKETQFLTKWQGKYQVSTLNKKKIKKSSTDATHIIDNHEKNIQDKLLISQLVETANKNLLPKIDFYKFFDLTVFSKALVSSLVWGEQNLHSIEPHNARFYLNPFTNLVEIFPSDHAHTFILEMNILNIKKQIKRMPKLYQEIIFTNEFQKEFLKSINIFEENISNIKEDFNNVCEVGKEICKKREFINVCKGFNPNNCSKVYYFDEIKKNILFLRKNYAQIFNDNFQEKINTEQLNNKSFFNLNKNVIKNKIHLSTIDHNNIKLYNLTYFPIIIKSLTIYNKFNKTIFKKENLNIKINGSNFSKIESYNFKNLVLKKLILKEISLDKYKYDNLIINIKFNFENDNKIFSKNSNLELISFSLKKYLKNLNSNNINLLKLKGKNYTIGPGKILVEKPIIIPKYFNLIINPNTQLIFGSNSYILIKKGNLNINGNKNQVIKLTAKDKNKGWRGIYVRGNKLDKSKIQFAQIRNINFFKGSGYFLTGGLNFYKSNLTFENSEIYNCISEDCLNIVKSKMQIKNVKFFNAKFDAFDSDFSEGVISNVEFFDIGGDGIDTSGSKIVLTNAFFKNIQDKALSFGEISQINFQDVYIENSNIGIAMKDGGNFNGKNVTILSTNIYDIALYRKKPFFECEQVKIDK